VRWQSSAEVKEKARTEEGGLRMIAIETFNFPPWLKTQLPVMVQIGRYQAMDRGDVEYRLR